ncbi:hypothetical protein L596_027287 [Steinernema carpocapsae]|uniref:TPL/SMU1 LisH-like dimerisation domain-containing protein n=1 Tax=Steinernema carpocapsae TaxID=34508 RepID=A0A4U5M3X4_STECR|nr:hypothetical protein L596_027287 [Steinernema carpocapsae]
MTSIEIEAADVVRLIEQYLKENNLLRTLEVIQERVDLGNVEFWELRKKPTSPSTQSTPWTPSHKSQRPLGCRPQGYPVPEDPEQEANRPLRTDCDRIGRASRAGISAPLCAKRIRWP